MGARASHMCTHKNAHRCTCTHSRTHRHFFARKGRTWRDGDPLRGFQPGLGPEPQREESFWTLRIWWEISRGAPLHLSWSPRPLTSSSRVSAFEHPEGPHAPRLPLQCLILEMCMEQPVQVFPRRPRRPPPGAGSSLPGADRLFLFGNREDTITAFLPLSQHMRLRWVLVLHVQVVGGAHPPHQCFPSGSPGSTVTSPAVQGVPAWTMDTWGPRADAGGSPFVTNLKNHFQFL